MKKIAFKLVILVIILLCVGGVFSLLKKGGSASMKHDTSKSVINPASDVGVLFSKDPAVPFTFSTGKLTGTISQHAISSVKDANYVLAHYKACGPKYRPKSYFPEMASTMKKLPETAFGFGAFQIILMPNLLGYKNFPAVQEDFFACSGDADVLVPAAMNDNWLVFTRACATDDTACANIASVVSSTIQVK
ncbi:MAG: hypothetical protein ABIP54_02955 [Candidatus Andersenbacteria bacterium]